MRVLQLIDSLRSGGAERMSVTYANALAKRIDASFLCCTRKEGLLKSQLSPEVGYLFLNKKNILDLQAFRMIRRFVKENKIDLIQAHSSSWFLALMVKLSLPGLKLVWHDHWGERALRNYRPGVLKRGSVFFDAVITVNPSLKNWAINNLMTENVVAIENFVPKEKVEGLDDIKLKGTKSFKIVHLANLKYPKDHFTLLEAVRVIKSFKTTVSLHLIGKDENDHYSRRIKKFINDHSLQENVFIYGEQENVSAFLRQAHLGVLSSLSEGLPLALLEYGLAGLPVVCTKVGACADVVGETGILVPASESASLAAGIEIYMNDRQLRGIDSKKFKSRILENYSEDVIIKKILDLFSSVIISNKSNRCFNNGIR